MAIIIHLFLLIFYSILLALKYHGCKPEFNRHVAIHFEKQIKVLECRLLLCLNVTNYYLHLLVHANLADLKSRINN